MSKRRAESKQASSKVVFLGPLEGYQEAAKALGLSESQYWRELNAGQIRTIQVRLEDAANGKKG